MRKSIYVGLSIIVLLLHYLIPYTLLYSCRGLVLTAYWVMLSLIWMLITIYFIRRC